MVIVHDTYTQAKLLELGSPRTRKKDYTYVKWDILSETLKVVFLRGEKATVRPKLYIVSGTRDNRLPPSYPGQGIV